MALKKISLVLALVFIVGVGQPQFVLAEKDISILSNAVKDWKLAFERDDNIWVANGDGSEQKMVINNGHSPAWSPDRKQIAFARNCNLWIAQIDGSRQHALTSRWKSVNPDFCEMHISWAPTRPIITFSHKEIYRVKRRGGSIGIIPHQGVRKGILSGTSIFEILTDRRKKAVVRYDIFDNGTSFNFSDHDNPAWSPTGLKLAFTRNGDIWLAEGVGGEPDDKTPSGVNVTQWDVTRIAAVATYDEPTWRGSRENEGVTRLSWSPDEKYLVYGIARLQGSGFAEVHILDLDNGKNEKLADDSLAPIFSPDGQYIAYWTYPGGNCEGGSAPCIWVVSLDRKVKKKILDNATWPAW